MNACPRCKDADMIGLIDPHEEEWYGVDPSDYEEGDEVWHCAACGWQEVADPDEALDYHLANLEWIMGKVAAIDAQQ